MEFSQHLESDSGDAADSDADTGGDMSIGEEPPIWADVRFPVLVR